MTERDIKHEADGFWVGDVKTAYTVYVAGITHSVADSSYPRDADGLSLAIARCDYLARTKVAELALGRILRLGSRPTQPGDVEDYEPRPDSRHARPRCPRLDPQLRTGPSQGRHRRRMTITIQTFPHNPNHRLVKVTTAAGRVYAATYAEGDDGWPTEESVRRDWRENRRAFRPYDESTGFYLG